MGAGVTTNPHFPKVGRRCRRRQHVILGRIGIWLQPCGSTSSPSRVPGLIAAAGPLAGILVEYRYSSDLPLRFRSRRLRFRWTASEIGSGLGMSPSPHASSSLVLPFELLAPFLRTLPPVARGSGLELSSVLQTFVRSGSAALGHVRKLSPFAESHKWNRLWMKCIMWISRARIRADDMVPCCCQRRSSSAAGWFRQRAPRDARDTIS